jgi:hypothetical protein
MPKTRRPIDPRLQNQVSEINFFTQPTVYCFTRQIAGLPFYFPQDWKYDPRVSNYKGRRPEDKMPPEIAAFGTRGDGKTFGALTGMILHAEEHQKAGFKLPVPWIGVTDTFTSHKLKTVRTLENPLWKGGWRLSDGDHIATYYLNGQALVRIDLFGIEDQGAMDRVRLETVGVWFEEPAPAAVLIQSSGISLDAWLLAGTSSGTSRIPSHFYPKVATLNYPDEDHWTWVRFIKDQAPGTVYYRIPPGERASQEDREMWRRALEGRPDLTRRLLDGQPGVVMMGDQVAAGFDLDKHVDKRQLPFVPGEPLFFGFDFGHTPTCVIGQPIKGEFRVKAGLWMINAGMVQLMEEQVRPYLARFAPWVLRRPDDCAIIGHDPSQGDISDPKGSEADIDNSALMAIQQSLGGGYFEAGPTKWEIRKDALVQTFQRRHVFVEEGQFSADLIKALAGRWYYARSHTNELRSDKPKKPNHPWEDLGDAFIYLLCRYGVVSEINATSSSGKVITNIQPGM